jgi:hypothetical protein
MNHLKPIVSGYTLGYLLYTLVNRTLTHCPLPSSRGHFRKDSSAQKKKWAENPPDMTAAL